MFVKNIQIIELFIVTTGFGKIIRYKRVRFSEHSSNTQVTEINFKIQSIITFNNEHKLA